MSIFWLHLRSSALRWWIGPLLVLDLAMLFLRTDYWMGIWPEAGAAAQVPGFFLSLVGVSAAAWTSGARSRQHVDEQLSAASLSTVRIEAARMAVVLFVVIVPYVVGAVVAAAVTLPQGAPGVGQYFAYVALGLVGLLLATGWGWLLGRLLPGRFAAVTALLSWLIVGYVLSDTTGMLAISGPPRREVSVEAVTVRGFVAVLFCLSLLALPFRRSAAGVRLTPAVVAVPVTTLGVAVTLLSTQPVVERPIPRAVPCVQGEIRVCYWPEHEKYVPVMEDVVARAEKLPDVFTLPSRLNEYGTERNDVVANGVLHRQVGGDFTIAEGSVWSLALDFSIAISGETFQGCDWDRAREAKDDRRITAVEHWMEKRLAGGGSPNYRIEAGASVTKARAVGARMAETKTEKEQFAWAEREVDEFRADYC